MKNFLTILFLFLVTFAKSQDTLTVMAYNILNYPLSNSTKADTLKPIIQYTQPDIFMITELTSSSGATTILNNALNVDGVTYYQKANYVNGPDTDNMMYYNSDKLVLYSQFEIATTLRNISEYVLYYNASGMTAASDTVFIYCYMAHLKASTGAANEQQRNQEAVTLKNYMDSRTNIENVILGGDFNFYTSAEAAHNTILNGGNVMLLDPISTPGNWNNNSFYSSIHTQSTRSGTIGDGGAFGGMDDRFDFIFFTNDLLSGANKLTYVPNSYKAVGNDGNHFNKSINATPTNTSAPANVIDALYIMSDHLPVVMKASLPINVGVEEHVVITSWKGFFSNNKFNFKSNKTEKQLTVFVYDVLGKTIQTASYKNRNQFSLQFNNLKQGLYFVKVVSGSNQQSFRLVKH
ncbi:MAG: T9SS type A sorting domain-containing protein [Flavobacteriales bacterium]|nr:T9SS type A sorting domain-containing protein [Flavobacteriales bacterium]